MCVNFKYKNYLNIEQLVNKQNNKVSKSKIRVAKIYYYTCERDHGCRMERLCFVTTSCLTLYLVISCNLCSFQVGDDLPPLKN